MIISVSGAAKKSRRGIHGYFCATDAIKQRASGAASSRLIRSRRHSISATANSNATAASGANQTEVLIEPRLVTPSVIHGTMSAGVCTGNIWTKSWCERLPFNNPWRELQ